MAITHTITKTWAGQTGSPITKPVVFTGSEELNLDATVDALASNQQVNLAFTKTLLQSIFITSDQTVTLKTNSSGAPQDTLTITASNPLEWDATSGITNPFAGNVTSGFLSNAGEVNANVQIRCLTNG